MASVKKHHRATGLDLLRERKEAVDHTWAIKVLAQDHGEAKFLQRTANRARVVHCLGKLSICWQIGIAVIANYKRHAVLRVPNREKCKV
jgi:hypothetical protein